jgi:hypothetical protein
VPGGGYLRFPPEDVLLLRRKFIDKRDVVECYIENKTRLPASRKLREGRTDAYEN